MPYRERARNVNEIRSLRQLVVSRRFVWFHRNRVGNKSGNVFNILHEIYALLHTIITSNLKVLLSRVKVFYERVHAI